MFDGHYQPHLPADLGFYDLRARRTCCAAGRARARARHPRLLLLPLLVRGQAPARAAGRRMLASGRPDLPFCLCWANENWTRRWDGADHGDPDRAAPLATRTTRRSSVDLAPPHARSALHPRRRARRWSSSTASACCRIPRGRPACGARVARREGAGELYLCAAKTSTPRSRPRSVSMPWSSSRRTACARAPVNDGVDAYHHGYASLLFDYNRFVHDWLNRDGGTLSGAPDRVPGLGQHRAPAVERHGVPRPDAGGLRALARRGGDTRRPRLPARPHGSSS